ncbi:hypothetical protein [uncultured Psychroserpens sp.]|uniref:hypothetical protein n=1 Tax=uncultured Psychroserpens sp. TaxID=255436 RepID=UPI00261CC76C|nr:hypothetical protein [uncultured Psychroserpens sp.]
MEKDTIDTLFERLDSQFDIHMPHKGHEDRFFSKLKHIDREVHKSSRPAIRFWKPLLAAAASIILCIAIYIVLPEEPELMDLANVSQELSQTQDFFTAAIQEELSKLEQERTPETNKLIEGALQQLSILETDYESLKKDLAQSGDDKRVIYAMITNFQNRINVLETVLDKVEMVKQIKTKYNVL